MRFNAIIFTSGGISALAAAVVIVFVSAGAGGEDEDARRQRLANLSLTEQEELERKREAFDDLDQSERARMRQLHLAISNSPDSERFQEVMQQYHEWLKTLTSQERANLRKLPAEERIAEIKELMEQQRHQRFREQVKTLEPQDGPAIFTWMEAYAVNHEQELLALLPERARRWMERSENRDRKWRMGLLMQLAHVSLPAPTDEEIAKLNDSLSQKAKGELAERTTHEEKLELVRDWVRAAAASQWAPQISNERLLAFYREYRQRTDDKKRVEEIDSLPSEAFYTEVKKLYFRDRGRGQLWRGRREGDHRGPPSAGREYRRDDEHHGGPRPGSRPGSDGEGDRDRPGPRFGNGQRVGEETRPNNGPRIGPGPRGDRPSSPPRTMP